MSETEFHPNWYSKPGDTLAVLLTQRGMSQSAFARLTGYEVQFVQDLVTGKARIDGSIAQVLAKTLGGKDSFWLTRQARFERALDNAVDAITTDNTKAWIQLFPRAEMASAGWIKKQSTRKEILKELLSFFDVADLDEWKERYTSYHADFSFRTSPTYESKLGAMSAWLRQGEIQADNVACEPWNPELFRESLADIRALTKAKEPSYFIPRLREICAAAGVAVVFVRGPSGCRASGATRFVASDKALMILSFRYLSDDHFWFTFFHETGHLLLHGRKATFVDSDGETVTQAEKEANAFSADMLIPPAASERLRKLGHTKEEIIRFAVSIGVSRGIVVGQMQHRKIIGATQLNWLKQHYTLDQIGDALRSG